MWQVVSAIALSKVIVVRKRRRAIEVIGDRWSLLVLRDVMFDDVHAPRASRGLAAAYAEAVAAEVA